MIKIWGIDVGIGYEQIILIIGAIVFVIFLFAFIVRIFVFIKIIFFNKKLSETDNERI